MPFITQGKTNWKFLLIVIILAIAVGVSALWCLFKKEQPYQPPEIKKSETADWKIYKNEEYNYEMKYPKDWTTEHSSGYDEEFEMYYESNKFRSPDGSYVLFFGIVPKDSNIQTPGLRTGVQAGDFVDSDEVINIGGIEVGFKNLVYEGKVKEIFFNRFETNGFKGGAWLSYFGNINHQEYDMTGKPELDIAKKILSTFKFIEDETTKEQACINSGGTVATASCCKSSGDFPNSCLIGACGCSPTDSHEVKTCDCGENKCWDGTKCTQSLH